MTSSGIEYLVITLVGCGILIWLSVVAMRQRTKVWRWLGIAMIALALLSLVMQVLRMRDSADEDWQKGFWRGMSTRCHEQCQKWETSETSCTSYCGCTMAQVRKGRSLSELKSWAEEGVQDGAVSPAMKLELEAIDLHCSAPLADDLFVKSCVEGCEGDLPCIGSCSCVLGKLRSGDRNEDTQWLIELLKKDEVTEADQARIKLASSACEGARATP